MPGRRPEWTTFAALCVADLRPLHVWCFERARAARVAIEDALRLTPEADREEAEQEWLLVAGHPAALKRGAGVASLRETHRQWLDFALALRALDHWHATRATSLSWAGWEPSPELGLAAGPWYLLPPEARQPSTLPRGPADFSIEIADALGLQCRVLAPGFVRPRRVPAAVDQRLPNAGLVVVIGTPLTGLRLWTTGDAARRGLDGRIPFTIGGLHPDDEPEARRRLLALVEHARRQDAHVLLLPELEIPVDLLAFLAEHLDRREGPPLVVAGSAHVDGRNRCTVLAGWGEELWRQDKLAPFGIPATEAVATESDRPGFLAALGIDARGGREDVAPGDDLVVCDARPGRLAVLICLDYCSGALDAELARAGANLLLVPAMTASTHEFAGEARRGGTRLGAAAWIANSGWLRGAVGRAVELALAYRPLRGRAAWITSGEDPGWGWVCRDGEVKSLDI